MDDFKKAGMHLIGPGGTKCPCCNDYFGKDKYKLNKAARKKLKAKLQKEILTIDALDARYE